METIFTKTSTTGRQIEVAVARYTAVSVSAHLLIDGQVVAAHTRPKRLVMPRGEVTHWIGKDGLAVGLTAAEAAGIEAGIEAAHRRQTQTDEARAALTAFDIDQQRRAEYGAREDALAAEQARIERERTR